MYTQKEVVQLFKSDEEYSIIYSLSRANIQVYIGNKVIFQERKDDDKAPVIIKLMQKALKELKNEK